MLGGLELLCVQWKHLSAEVVKKLLCRTEIVARQGKETRLVILSLRLEQVMGDLGGENDAVWRELGASVFYRLERGTDVSVSPPMVLHTSARYLRVLPDDAVRVWDWLAIGDEVRVIN